jgi:hypothetical protein
VSQTITCEDVAERALIERYVSGRLEQPEADALEEHYLVCARCREDVRVAIAVRGTLPGVLAEVGRARRRFVPVGIGVGAAAAGIAVILLLRPGPRGDLAPLGAVREPPIYLGIQVRATPARADSLFEAAMTDYAARRYDAAADGLRAALAAGVDSVPAQFFLAASLLMEDRPREAAAAFRSAIALGDSPYLGESRFYLAKALLRLGKGEEAVTQLQLAGAAGGEVGRHATTLMDTVEVMLRR